MRFWDSSALVALALPEQSSRACARLYEEDPEILVWALTSVEIASALHRRRREGELSRELLTQAAKELEQLRDGWSEVMDLGLVCPRAERIVAVHDVRAADALQLAAALVASNERPREIPFVSLDVRLSEAARREGFTVLPA